MVVIYTKIPNEVNRSPLQKILWGRVKGYVTGRARVCCRLLKMSVLWETKRRKILGWYEGR